MTFCQRLTGLLGLAAVLALASGCDDYTYFNIFVYLRQTGNDAEYVRGETQRHISVCSIAVFYGDRQIENSRILQNQNTGADLCMPDKTGMDPSLQMVSFGDGTTAKLLGISNYSTARTSGTLTFVVTGKERDMDQVVDLVQGSAKGEISPGKILKVDLIINECPRENPSDKESKRKCPFTDIR